MNFFYLQQLHAAEKDYTHACSVLGLGVDYAGLNKAEYARILFMLTKGMVIFKLNSHRP